MVINRLKYWFLQIQIVIRQYRLDINNCIFRNKIPLLMLLSVCVSSYDAWIWRIPRQRRILDDRNVPATPSKLCRISSDFCFLKQRKTLYINLIIIIVSFFYHSVLNRKAASCHASTHNIRRLALGRVQSDDSCQGKKMWSCLSN